MTSIRTPNNNRPASGSSSSASMSRSPPATSATAPLTSGRRRTPTPAVLATTPGLMVTVKREEGTTAANEEIKEFAETAMNELLGWYGYGAPENSSKRSSTVAGPSLNGLSGDFSKDNSQQIRSNNRLRRVNDHHRESQSQSPHSLSNSPTRISPEATSGRTSSTCDWCHRQINRDAETYGTTEGIRFCSEPCFAQSRRASFKRAKTCDWCRHVRHAVSYVDFQDGASQLQFCSDKCLNQYKMQIFIKETQAHLEMNPHLMEKSEGSGTNLITPELWLKNCRSRSASPEVPKSRSVSPEGNFNQPPPVKVNQPEVSGPSSTVIRPTITVAPVSKLLPPPSQSNPVDMMSGRPSMKTMRKQRRTLRNGPPVRDHPSYSHSRVMEENPPPVGKGPTSSHPRQCAISPGSSNLMPGVHDLPKGPGPRNPGEQIMLNSFDSRFLSSPPNLYPIRPNMVPPPLFRPMDQPHHMQPIPTPMPTLRPGGAYGGNLPRFHRPESQNYNGQLMGNNQIPPVTILVPCPIILPIPVPIPIPISMPEFLTKLLSMSNSTNDSSSNPPESINNPRSVNDENNNSSTGTGSNYPMDCSNNPSNATEKISSARDSTRDLNNGAETDSELSENGSSTKSCEIVPKMKITRLQSKRILTSKELDSSRPLRKRKRMVVASYT